MIPGRTGEGRSADKGRTGEQVHLLDNWGHSCWGLWEMSCIRIVALRERGMGIYLLTSVPYWLKVAWGCSIFGISGLPCTQTEQASEDTEAAAYLWWLHRWPKGIRGRMSIHSFPVQISQSLCALFATKSPNYLFSPSRSWAPCPTVSSIFDKESGTLGIWIYTGVFGEIKKYFCATKGRNAKILDSFTHTML